MKKFLIPLAAFIVLAVFLAVGLKRDPREVPSPFIGKPAPAFALPRLDDPARSFGPKDMLGKVWMLNVWASWCVSCREEHPLLVEFAKAKIIPIVGLDYKDKTVEAKAWLERFGDPYELSIVDADGRVGIDYGVYGVPETYVVDKQGVIRFKQIGPITPQVVQNKLIPLIKELSK